MSGQDGATCLSGNHHTVLEKESRKFWRNLISHLSEDDATHFAAMERLGDTACFWVVLLEATPELFFLLSKQSSKSVMVLVFVHMPLSIAPVTAVAAETEESLSLSSLTFSIANTLNLSSLQLFSL